MDEADQAGEHIENVKAAGIEKSRKAAADIPKGCSGECDYCGLYRERLVGGNCAKCRDEYKLG